MVTSTMYAAALASSMSELSYISPQVTSFLSSHPGGSKVILSLAGKDATEEYDPVHPPGTLEDNLPPTANLGPIDPNTLPTPVQAAPTDTNESPAPVPLAALLNLNEIEAAATKKLSRKGWAYYFSAADDLHSKSHNNTVYRSILLRPRIFIDCTTCSVSTTFLSHPLQHPVFVSPAAMARLAHPSGEHGIAQACAKFGAMQIISNNASLTPEQVVEGASPEQIFGWQLYVQTERRKSEDMLARINKLDAIKFVVLTLDAPVPGKREDDERGRFIVEDTSELVKDAGGSELKGGSGIGQSLFFGTDPSLTWRTTLPWLRKQTRKPIVLKGLQTHEDVYLASLEEGVKGVILSNHGGRALDTAPPSVHTLMECRKYVPEVFDRLDIVVDGGVKRGTDVVKALALGAKAVGIGRAALFGLGAGGVEGVERVLEILRDETATAMRLLGVETVGELGARHLNTRVLEREIFDGPSGVDEEKMSSVVKVAGAWVKSKL